MGLEWQAWAAHEERSEDSVAKRSKERFVDLVKNTYRVLLSRGMMGCYARFPDRDAERFVRARIETSTASPFEADHPLVAGTGPHYEKR
ncbi:MAG: DUF2075 domain-containing protein [Deltaproteobacteria bacterium]|nr:DUF2075 domain-containing protein [Deltaproteobacteria bacterium]